MTETRIKTPLLEAGNYGSVKIGNELTVVRKPLIHAQSWDNPIEAHLAGNLRGIVESTSGSLYVELLPTAEDLPLYEADGVPILQDIGGQSPARLTYHALLQDRQSIQRMIAINASLEEDVLKIDDQLKGAIPVAEGPLTIFNREGKISVVNRDPETRVVRANRLRGMDTKAPFTANSAPPNTTRKVFVFSGSGQIDVNTAI
jgi:hypothetical protein